MGNWFIRIRIFCVGNARKRKYLNRVVTRISTLPYADKIYVVSNPVCPVCKGPLIGRSDKKYCSDKCRYISNNKSKTQNEQPINDVNRALRKNRSILRRLCPVGKAVVRKEVLLEMGYQPRFFSSLFLTSNKQIYYICYDYAFTPLVDHNVEKALIVSRQDYMGEWDPWRFVNKKPWLISVGNLLSAIVIIGTLPVRWFVSESFRLPCPFFLPHPRVRDRSGKPEARRPVRGRTCSG